MCTMKKRTNYYAKLEADYSRPGLVTKEVGDRLIKKAEAMIAQKEKALPPVDAAYPLSKIEQENKDWWPTHCEALRRGRGDILTAEYVTDLVYLCQDGPY